MIHCPVCDAENIEGDDHCRECGVSLSDSHLYEARNPVERGLLKDRISLLTPKVPITVKDSSTIGEVLTLMVERGIGCVFVVADDGSLVGVFSERDALLRLNPADPAYGSPIATVMSKGPQGLSHNSKIAYAVHQMDLGSFRHVPIVDESENIEGVISVRDILRYLNAKMIEPEVA